MNKATEQGVPVPESLRMPELAPAWQYYLTVFLDLSSARAVGMAPCPIGYSDLDAYARLYGISFTPWEVKLFRQLDVRWMKAVIEKRTKGS